VDPETPAKKSESGRGRRSSFLRSSIGEKSLMALTGLALVGFLIVHLAGNLTLFADEEGAAFDRYAKGLEDSPLLLVAELGLALLFLAHIALALRTSFENREARSERYAIRTSLGKRTLASSSMLVTGVVILVFLVIHLLDFRLRERAPDGLAAMVVRRLSTPLGAGIYLLGVAAVGLHLSHAVRSALQSLGLNHSRYNLLMTRGGLALALILFAGFASFPIVLLSSPRSTSTAKVAGAHEAPAQVAPPLSPAQAAGRAGGAETSK
jgi:succinate dehydrogenase cytochrome b subunit